MEKCPLAKKRCLTASAKTCEADTADAGGWVIPRSLFVSSAAFVRNPGIGEYQCGYFCGGANLALFGFIYLIACATQSLETPRTYGQDAWRASPLAAAGCKLFDDNSNFDLDGVTSS